MVMYIDTTCAREDDISSCIWRMSWQQQVSDSNIQTSTLLVCEAAGMLRVAWCVSCLVVSCHLPSPFCLGFRIGDVLTRISFRIAERANVQYDNFRIALAWVPICQHGQHTQSTHTHKHITRNTQCHAAVLGVPRTLLLLCCMCFMLCCFVSFIRIRR